MELSFLLSMTYSSKEVTGVTPEVNCCSIFITSFFIFLAFSIKRRWIILYASRTPPMPGQWRVGCGGREVGRGEMRSGRALRAGGLGTAPTGPTAGAVEVVRPARDARAQRQRLHLRL